jgi:sulfur-oxidizing protein SoxZ
MKIKAKLKDGVVSAQVMAKHEMLTYDTAEKKYGDRNKANYITYVTGTVNGKLVFEASTSQFLSKNPILKFKFKGAASGDKLVMTWVDLKGNTKTDDKEIK